MINLSPRRSALARALWVFLGVGCTELAPGQPHQGIDVASPGDADAGPRADTLRALPDASPDCPGGFGCPCEQNKDCDSEYCLATRDGKRCSQTCSDGCPAGWECSQLSATDPTYVCVDPFANLCRPCYTDAQCTGAGLGAAVLCLPAPAAGTGSYCHAECGDASQCPAGYACELAALPGGGSASVCRPLGGECACNGLAIEDNAATTCELGNPLGTCSGTRRCTASGLAGCDAPTPAAEACNQIDDDCDGLTDEVLTEGCDVENLHGTCPGTRSCGPAGWSECAGKVPAAEVCDGQDNDCDGATDGFTESCYPEEPNLSGVGLCAAGKRWCTGGAWGACEDAVLPGPELCDLLDQDCDGSPNPPPDACYTGLEGTLGVGVCHGGLQTCADGSWGACEGEVTPAAAEQCANALDDTCDGHVNEGCLPTRAVLDFSSVILGGPAGGYGGGMAAGAPGVSGPMLPPAGSGFGARLGFYALPRPQ